MNFIYLESKQDLEKAFDVMCELRTHLSQIEFLRLHDEMKKEGYQLVAASVGDQILGLMGYRIITDLVRGRHLYIDDLVTAEKSRSNGIGSELLKFAEKIALEKNCTSLRLCTGKENERGKKFYEREGWTLRSVAYVKSILP